MEPTEYKIALSNVMTELAKLDDTNLRAFLEYCSERWKLIFWIPGNSEIWESSKSEEISLKKMKTVCSTYKNINILYMNTYLLEEDSEKLLVVGLPLWHKPRDGMMLHYEKNIYIKPLPSPIDSEIFKEAHKRNVEFLEKIIKKSRYPLLICSYYPPFTWLYEEDWIQEISSAIIDRELEKLVTYPIISWIVGHNHLPIEYSRRYFLTDGSEGSVLFVSNPRGKKEQFYRKEAVIRLQPNMLKGFEPEEVEEVPIWAMMNR